MNKFPMTKAGETALREELDRLKKVERPRIVEAIAEARARKAELEDMVARLGAALKRLEV